MTRFSSRQACRLACMALVVIFCPFVRGLEPTRAVKDYKLTEWLAADGLPYPSVRCLAQSGDGYLWIGTRVGLGRFDGLNFAIYDKANELLLVSDDIQALYTASNGTLWVGTAKGLVWYQNGTWSRPDFGEEIQKSVVCAFTEDKSGSMWIMTSRGLFCCAKDGKCELKAPLHPKMVPGAKAVPSRFETLIFSPKGELFVTDWGAGLYKLQAGRFREVIPDPSVSFLETRSLVFDRAGGMWIATDRGLHYWKDGKLRSFSSHDGLPANAIRSLLIDRDDNVWIGTINGLARYTDGKFQTVIHDGEKLSHVLSLDEDHEGNVWVGTDNGLIRLSDLKVTIISQRDGLPSNAVLSVMEGRDGSKWVGTWG
ncbi:MAG: hypothetical protein KGJ37_03770, partial [Verrucomicrobiota bacterium]|nr:hypothetical protein [Verrucomicrobiota bacterium]